MKQLGIKQMEAGDQPREKLLAHGPHSLSDAELLAIMIRTGNTQMSAIGLAQHLLSAADNSLSELGRKSVAELCKIKGIGQAKAVEIMAALELGKRRYAAGQPNRQVIKSSQDAFYAISPRLMDLNTEEFWIVICNRANKVIDQVRISAGGIHGTVVDVKVVMRIALEKGACSLVLAHNHPSGGLTPSEEDIRLTRKLVDSAALMDIRILDHLIIAGNQYFSFLDEGLL